MLFLGVEMPWLSVAMRPKTRVQWIWITPDLAVLAICCLYSKTVFLDKSLSRLCLLVAKNY